MSLLNSRPLYGCITVSPVTSCWTFELFSVFWHYKKRLEHWWTGFCVDTSFCFFWKYQWIAESCGKSTLMRSGPSVFTKWHIHTRMYTPPSSIWEFWSLHILTAVGLISLILLILMCMQFCMLTVDWWCWLSFHALTC